MQKLSIALLIMALTVVALGLHYYPVWLPVNLGGLMGFEPEPGAAVPVAPLPQREVKPPSSRSHKHRATEQPADSMPQSSISVAVRVLPFPKETNLPSGMSRAEVIGAFGSPAFAAIWTDGGGIDEKFFYLAGETVTGVLFEHGKVISSKTNESGMVGQFPGSSRVGIGRPAVQ